MVEVPLTLAIFNDLGGGEMLVVGLVALLLFGKDLPHATRKFGKIYSEIKRGLNDASYEIRREMDNAARSIDEATKDAKDSFADTSHEIKSALNEPFKTDTIETPAIPPEQISTVAETSSPEIARKPVPAETPVSLDAPLPLHDISTTPAASAPVPRTNRINSSMSPTAALDTFKRDVALPTKIPPPV